MALKITTQVGTDKGITSEAYVLISEYKILKYGLASFTLEIYQSEAEKNASNNVSILNDNKVKNQQIGTDLLVPLLKDVSHTTTITNVNTYGEEIITEEVIIVKVPDLSMVKEVDIFTFGYSHLKTKLVDLFGEGNVVDC